MRVDARGSQAPNGAELPAARPFAEALRRARGHDRPPAVRAPPAAPRQGVRGTHAQAVEAGREERVASGGALAAPPVGVADAGAVPEIAALARALPTGIAAARARDGQPLTLSFGRSLHLELRSGADGVEILLRPAPSVLRAAEAELPRLVAALQARGVAVARAAVRGRDGSGPRPR